MRGQTGTGTTTLLMLLTAVDAGLGGLFFGLAPEAITAVRAAFGVPADHEPIGVLALTIGHPPRVGRPAQPGGAGARWMRWSTGAAGELLSYLPTGRSMATRTAGLALIHTGRGRVPEPGSASHRLAFYPRRIPRRVAEWATTVDE
jgi:hypothetical protein